MTGDGVVAEKALCEGAPCQASNWAGVGREGLEKIHGEDSKKLWQDCRKGPLVVLVGNRCHLQTELQIGVGSWNPA